MVKSNEPRYENFQVYRVDGKNKFLEILSRSFEIGKVIFNFVEYDDTKAAGSRITQQIMIYMDFPRFRVFAHDMLSGRFAKLAEQKTNPLFQDLTGTSAQRLAAQNRAREDGKAESRKLTLSPAAKGFFLTAEAGPGEETETGLIKPTGSVERRVSIVLDPDHAKELVLTTLAAMDAYETAKETVRQFEAIRKARLNTSGKTA